MTVTVKPSVWVPASGASFWCSLGSQGATDWPNSWLNWPSGVTAGWGGGDLANWNKLGAVLGKSPGGTRIYWTQTDLATTTGISGSAGSYGTISSDLRTIFNSGAGAVCSFTFGTTVTGGAPTWQQVANGVKDAYLDNLGQNIKRWFLDTGNTSVKRKIILAYHHEPSNDALGTPGDYKLAFQHCVTYLAQNWSIGPGLTYDCVEWAFIDIAFQFSAGANTFFPGDSFVTWVFADPYNWGGGLAHALSKNAHFPTTGDDLGATTNDVGRYNASWTPISQPTKRLLDFSDNHPTLNYGLTEWACSPDIDRYTWNTSTFVLTGTKSHTALPGLMPEWVKQSVNYFSGLPSDVGVNAANAFTADPRAKRLKILCYWNSQALAPRWLNMKPVMPNATDAQGPPGSGYSGGTTAHDILDAFVFLINSSWFSGTAAVPPHINAWAAAPDDSTPDGSIETLNVTPGGSTVLTYATTRSDGSTASGSLTANGDGTYGVTNSYAYAADGLYASTTVVTDGNGQTATATASVSATGGTGTRTPLPLSGLLKLQAGDDLGGFSRWGQLDAMMDLLESNLGKWAHVPLHGDATSWTAMPSTVTQYKGVSTGAQNAKIDLTNRKQMKFSMTVSANTVSTARLVPAYSLDGGTTWKAFDAATSTTTAGTTITTGGAGPLTGPIVSFAAIGPSMSSVVNIPVEARGEVLVTMFGWGGDGTSNPQPNFLQLIVR